MLALPNKVKFAQMNGLFTGDGLREMLEKKKHYAADMIFPIVASLNDRKTEFVPSSDLT